MKKINWKVRLKNPIFWATFGASLVAFVYTVLSLFDITPAFSQDIVIKAITTLISALTTIGVLVDPTTKGIKDSDQAMTYK